MAIVIVVLAGVAVALVHIRRREITTRYEIQRMRLRQEVLRRDLGVRKMLLAKEIAPAQVRRMADEMALGLRNGNTRPIRSRAWRTGGPRFAVGPREVR